GTNAQDGDCIYIHGGQTYYNHNFGSGGLNNGAAMSLKNLRDIMVTSLPGTGTAKIKIDGSGGIVASNVVRLSVSNLEIEGPNADITFSAAQADRLNHSPYFSGRGIVVWSGSHIHVHSCHVHHTANSAIRANKADYMLVEGNRVHSSTWWTSNGESAIVIAEAEPVDGLDEIKMRIVGNEVYDNENRISYYNENYDDPEYLEKNQMHVARENYGSSLQDFIIDGSGVYITRNSNSYVTGRMELSNNLCYRNGINGVVVHKTDRVLVKNNVIFDNGQVPREAPQSRQAYAGLTINNSEDVTVYNNSVVTTLPDDYAYAISGTTYGFIDEFGVDRTAPENLNRHCGGLVKSDFGDRVVAGVA
ncbi:hypothetical protein TrRE_jg6982, partial [Triparma retinervis]